MTDYEVNKEPALGIPGLETVFVQMNEVMNFLIIKNRLLQLFIYLKKFAFICC
jgi:hypothetical protein